MAFALLLSGIGAFGLGVWAGSLSSRTMRFAGFAGVLLLVVPIYAGCWLLGFGPNDFGWWLVGLPMVALPWSVFAFAGFVLYAIRRRRG